MHTSVKLTTDLLLLPYKHMFAHDKISWICQSDTANSTKARHSYENPETTYRYTFPWQKILNKPQVIYYKCCEMANSSKVYGAIQIVLTAVRWLT